MKRLAPEALLSTPGNTPAYSYTFQPIIDTSTSTVHAYETLLRGSRNEPPSIIFQDLDADAIEHIDQRCRPQAIALAAQLGVNCRLHLNFQPRSLVTSAAVIRTTLAAAGAVGIGFDQIVLEVTETQMIDDHERFAAIVNEFRGDGVKVAIDDFGAGYSGLNLLANFQPDLVKLDMGLVRGIARHGPRQAIVRAIMGVCLDLGIEFLAEGVESVEEFRWFEHAGVALFQGYLFAKPAFEALPVVKFPEALPRVHVI